MRAKLNLPNHDAVIAAESPLRQGIRKIAPSTARS
jgi:hypothetical protein